MIFKPSRDREGDARLFPVKAMLLVLGTSLGIAGMATEREWLVYTAIVIIAVGILLRLVR